MDIYKKIQALEKELFNLKSIILMRSAIFKTPKKVSLKGSLKGIKVHEQDIEKAKKSLFRTGG
ncbi:hypothetical protein HYV81_00895 [Candidatus Woesearchaeota archaeon]|nr:hypothetical protein [Candidatus Woesearchaeota archaeon]